MPTVNDAYALALQLKKREVNLYPRVYIYISSQEIGQSPKALNHINSGAYYNQFTPSSEGYYLLQSNVYTDEACTSLSGKYGSGFELIKVDSVEDDVTYISSNLEVYAYGGGKGDTVVVAGKKSPWTHKQKDTILADTKETKKLIKEVSKDIDKYHDEEMKEIFDSSAEVKIKIDNLLSDISNVRKQFKSIPNKKEFIKKLDDITMILNEYKKELEGKSTVDDVSKIKSDVDKIRAKLASDEELDELYKEVNKND